MEKKKKVWLITGCSSGLGRALAEEVLASGDIAALTARDTATLTDLVASCPDRAIALKLDVTDSTAIQAAVDEAVARLGRIDVLVNNAGFGTVGALEEIDDLYADQAMDANFFGVYRMCRAVLPAMRRQASGSIINVSSMLGFSGAAGYAFYSAAKFAVEGLSEALAAEVAPFGIKVTIIQPGPFRTDFRKRSMRVAPVHPAYSKSLSAFREGLLAGDGKQPGDPRKAARLMIDIANAEEPPLRLPVGKAALAAVERKLDLVRHDIDRWRDASLATAFADA